MYYTTDDCILCMKCIEECPTKAIIKTKKKSFNCVTCGKCAEVCPSKAIFKNQYGGYVVDMELCTGCGICKKNCPFGFIEIIDNKSHGECSMCGVCQQICPSNAKRDVTGILEYNVKEKTFEDIERVPSPEKKGEVMKTSIFIDREKCTNCGKCRMVCPSKAMILDAPEGVCTDCKHCEEICPTKAITLPNVSDKRCINCYKCVRECPVNAISMEDGKITINTGENEAHIRYCVNCNNCVDSCNYEALIRKGIRIRYLSDVCTDCNLCLMVCPYDMRRKINDLYLGHCILCGRCVKTCPENAISIKRVKWTGDVNEGCVNCGLCMELCPRQCIYVDKDGFSADLERCDLCGVCSMVCPMDAITFEPYDVLYITDGSVEYNPNLCVHCKLCISQCPTDAISDDMVWDIEKCIFCGACDNICPGHAVKVKTYMDDLVVDGRTKEVRK